MVVTEEWDKILSEEYTKNYFKELMIFVNNEYNTKVIYPAFDNIFNALKMTKYNDIKVVVIGQDPYHGEGEAHGLAFSVQEGIKLPPSLVNIFKELERDLGIKRTRGTLDDWAKQGVLLLNTVLTVERDKPNSHKKKGWEMFTDAVIKKINEMDKAVVFILWGNNARQKKQLITNTKHLILESTHPSPFSCRNGFEGSMPFSKTNEFLNKHINITIKW